MALEAWHTLGPDEVLRELEVDPAQGLTRGEAARRLEQYGPNALPERGAKSVWRIVGEQFRSTLVILLIVAAVVSAFLGDEVDAIAIFAIVALNAALGARQEYKANEAMASLRKMSQPTVKVRREGSLEEVVSAELVPGDILALEAGMLIPADARLIEAANLRVQESALTGESEPVDKDAAFVADEDTALGDRSNAVYRGSSATYGRGLAVVVNTGEKTELGRIAEMLQSVESDETPLQKRLEQLGKILAVVALLLVGVVFALGVARGEDMRLMFLTAVSLAVAAVPEGLPAVVTVALALGAQRMLKRNALIRKLPAVETLGSVTVICADKTGTLTENRMTVTAAYLEGREVRFDEDRSDEEGLHVALLLAAGALCNDAEVERDESQPGGYRTVGDPTETALVVAADRRELAKSALEAALPRTDEIPFESDRKRMTTVHGRGETAPPEELAADLERVGLGSASRIVFVKGASDSVIEHCAERLVDGERRPLDDAGRQKIQEAHDRLASDGARLLAVAYRTLDDDASVEVETTETDLVFIGLLVLVDPARPEAYEAVQKCHRAGIRTVMITGDHPLTARAIARELEIDERQPVTGVELGKHTDEQIQEDVNSTGVFARVSPEHKLRLVKALQEQNQIVAMTGDGVNDAPALRRADIGVAMGQVGVDVATQASDMVLRDDNFATIVAAVEEGRAIYDNVRRFIKYLLSANTGELLTMLGGSLLGMPLPLLPLQILWMNLITDGPPALALGIEPAEEDVMERPPAPPGESVFARGVGRDILWIGLLMAAVGLGIGYTAWREGVEAWRTMTFTTLTLGQVLLALALRSDRRSLFRIGFGGNPAMAAAAAGSFALHLCVVYVPFLQEAFGTQALTMRELLICLGGGTVVFAAVEIKKLLFRN